VTDLCDNPVEGVHQHEVVDGRGVCVQADLEHIVVVRRDAETRHKTIDVQIQVLTHDVLATGECLTVRGRVKQQCLQ